MTRTLTTTNYYYPWPFWLKDQSQRALGAASLSSPQGRQSLQVPVSSPRLIWDAMVEQPRRDGTLYEVDAGTWRVVCAYCKDFEGKDPPAEQVFGAPAESVAKDFLEQAGWAQAKSKNMYKQRSWGCDICANWVANPKSKDVTTTQEVDTLRAEVNALRAEVNGLRDGMATLQGIVQEELRGIQQRVAALHGEVATLRKDCGTEGWGTEGWGTEGWKDWGTEGWGTEGWGTLPTLTYRLSLMPLHFLNNLIMLDHNKANHNIRI